MKMENVKSLVYEKKDSFVSDMLEMSAIPSVNPRCGGLGEYARCKWIANTLASMGYEYEWIEVPDSDVPEGCRVSIIVRVQGNEDHSHTLWFIGHTDTVSAGDISQWDTDPFVPTVCGDKIIGLGVEDNSQAVTSFIGILRILKEQNLIPRCDTAFLFVADEECGSDFGLCSLIDSGYFGGNDQAVIPDYGCSDGSFIEIAEKSTGYVKFTVTGKQGHASMPHKCNNAYSASNHFAALLEDTLKETFTETDSLFDPPFSTFEPTQTFSNVASPNVIPGCDVFFMDMRILPSISLHKVISCVENVISSFEDSHEGISIDIEPHLNAAPMPTSPDSRISQALLASIRQNGMSNVQFGGIGGGTCAAILRREGIPAVVWSRLIELAHQPNEHILIENLLTDATVFISLLLTY